MKARQNLWMSLLACALIMLIAATIERSMGRLWISQSGHIHFWVGKVASAENSQQIADWYSFSHIIHGFFFYWVTYLISRGRWSVGSRLVLAILLESTWEVIENTPYIINYYRTATVSLGYTGDTVLNSMSDILCAAIGFALARRSPVRVTLCLVLIMEIGCAIAIRDNLTLNVLMFIHPFEGIKHWQSGTLRMTRLRITIVARDLHPRRRAPKSRHERTRSPRQVRWQTCKSDQSRHPCRTARRE